MLKKERRTVSILDVNIILFTKEELLEKINEIPDNTKDIEIVPVAFWYWDETIHKIDFEYTIEREETDIEKTLREAREVREKRRQDARKK